MEPTIKAAWEEYRRDVVAPSIPPSVISDFQMTFYAGALSMMDLVMKVAERAPNKQDGTAMIAAWVEELESFLRAQMEEA